MSRMWLCIVNEHFWKTCLIFCIIENDKPPCHYRVWLLGSLLMRMVFSACGFTLKAAVSSKKDQNTNSSEHSTHLNQVWWSRKTSETYRTLALQDWIGPPLFYSFINAALKCRPWQMFSTVCVNSGVHLKSMRLKFCRFLEQWNRNMQINFPSIFSLSNKMIKKRNDRLLIFAFQWFSRLLMLLLYQIIITFTCWHANSTQKGPERRRIIK